MDFLLAGKRNSKFRILAFLQGVYSSETKLSRIVSVILFSTSIENAGFKPKQWVLAVVATSGLIEHGEQRKWEQNMGSKFI